MQKHKAHTVKVLDLLDAFRIAVSDGLHRQACRSSDLKTKTKSPRDMPKSKSYNDEMNQRLTILHNENFFMLKF